ncbi:MAG: hypothetical protein JWL91_207 [Sphingomonas bacterium]|nr:peptidase S14 [Sphingomonas bacterium]MDB5688331.1 hypothetical protein [Sphingomonas bacterium]
MAFDDPIARPQVTDIPQIRLSGSIDDGTLSAFNTQLAGVAPGDVPITVELSTLGGDAEVGRRLALEAKIAARSLAPRTLLFLGKTTVFSAGVTMMSGFPRDHRFLTEDTVLLIHCRQLQKTIEIQTSLRGAKLQIGQILSEIENGLRVEKEDFAALIADSDVSMDELLERAGTNWYVPAREALDRGLIGGIV